MTRAVEGMDKVAEGEMTSIMAETMDPLTKGVLCTTGHHLACTKVAEVRVAGGSRTIGTTTAWRGIQADIRRSGRT